MTVPSMNFKRRISGCEATSASPLTPLTRMASVECKTLAGVSASQVVCKNLVCEPLPHCRNAHSSPRSVVAPIGPDRLTLPPSHQQPSFSTGQHHSDDTAQAQVDRQSFEAGYIPSRERPGSRRFTECAFLATSRASSLTKACTDIALF